LVYKFGCSNSRSKREQELEQSLEDARYELNEKEEEISKLLEDKEQELNSSENNGSKDNSFIKDASQNKENGIENKEDEFESNVVTEEEAQILKEKTIKSIRMSGAPTFLFGTAILNNKGKEKLKEIATELESYPDASILIEGHTDSVGSDEVNQKISEQRASAAARMLKQNYGVPNFMTVIGKGKKEPIASNDTAEGRAQNRRVEIILTTIEEKEFRVLTEKQKPEEKKIEIVAENSDNKEFKVTGADKIEQNIQNEIEENAKKYGVYYVTGLEKMEQDIKEEIISGHIYNVTGLEPTKQGLIFEVTGLTEEDVEIYDMEYNQQFNQDSAYNVTGLEKAKQEMVYKVDGQHSGKD